MGEDEYQWTPFQSRHEMLQGYTTAWLLEERGRVMREDEREEDMSLEARIKRARVANLALYLDEPTPEAAELMVTFERVVLQLRGQEKRRQEAEGGA